MDALSGNEFPILSALFKLEILSFVAYGFVRWCLKSRWDLDKPRK